jgi:hypothetical protein
MLENDVPRYECKGLEALLMHWILLYQISFIFPFKISKSSLTKSTFASP